MVLTVIGCLLLVVNSIQLCFQIIGEVREYKHRKEIEEILGKK